VIQDVSHLRLVVAVPEEYIGGIVLQSSPDDQHRSETFCSDSQYRASSVWIGPDRHVKLVTLDEFMKKFPHFVLRCRQGLSAERRGPIYSPQRLAVALPGGSQVPLFFEPLEQRIQTPRTEAVAVPRKFIDHAQTEDRPVSSVMKNVQPDQPRIQITVRRGRVLL